MLNEQLVYDELIPLNQRLQIDVQVRKEDMVLLIMSN